MRTRFRWDKDLECLVEIGSNANYFEEKGEAPSVISDDLKVGVNGLKHIPSGKHLDSKAAHYRENKARGLEHVGNETDFASQKEKPKHGDYMQEAAAAQAQIQNNWNGTRDWLARQKEQGRNIRWDER